MFGLFKKKPPTVMDGMIRMIYGANPPPKSADLERSIIIAHEDLLFEKVPLSEVKRTAGELFKGPVPYSTHDLAVSTALGFFRNAEYVPALQECQIAARLRVVNWAKDGKVAKLLAQSFEEVLYKFYKPQPWGPPKRPMENQEAEKPTGVTDDDDRGFNMFSNKPKQNEETDKALNYSRALALRVIETMKLDKTKDDIEPEERVLHLQALNMAATMYIVSAPDPRLCLRMFIEVLEDEVVPSLPKNGKMRALVRWQMTMWKAISGVLVGLCLASTQAMATDATWYCSAFRNNSVSAEKYVVRGRELIDLEVVWNELMPLPGPDQPKGKKGVN